MATCIHHGPPGSYKTFTLVQRIAIPELEKGRVIVTNIRDFDDIARVRKAFPEKTFPPESKIIAVPEDETGRGELARFFHWAPAGALILIDEGQRIFPKRRDFKIEMLDRWENPYGREVEPVYKSDGSIMPRPEDIHTAFDMQRHFNWDIYVSTPNIDKLHDFIRQVADWAYRHRSIDGVLPWYKGTWYEHQHDAETSGKSVSHVVGAPVRYKVDGRVYDCYSSTATGEHLSNKTGRSVFSDPRLRWTVVGLFLVFCYFLYGVYSKVSTGEGITSVSMDSQKSDPAVGNTRVNDVDTKQSGSANNSVGAAVIYSLVERRGNESVFIKIANGQTSRIKSGDLIKRGYAIIFSGTCNVSLINGRRREKIDAGCDRLECRVHVEWDDHVVRRDCDTPMGEAGGIT